MICWIHFGDLHIAGDEQNYRDFLTLIEESLCACDTASIFASSLATMPTTESKMNTNWSKKQYRVVSIRFMQFPAIMMLLPAGSTFSFDTSPHFPIQAFN